MRLAITVCRLWVRRLVILALWGGCRCMQIYLVQGASVLDENFIAAWLVA